MQSSYQPQRRFRSIDLDNLAAIDRQLWSYPIGTTLYFETGSIITPDMWIQRTHQDTAELITPDGHRQPYQIAELALILVDHLPHCNALLQPDSPFTPNPPTDDLGLPHQDVTDDDDQHQLDLIPA